MATDEAQKDLRAAMAARQELGADYEPEIIDAFLEKVDARIAERVAAVPVPQPQLPPKDDPGGLALAIVSVVAGIPITAIAANQEGTIAIIICWGGIVGVNLARSISRFMGR
ncbi:hypothetical protein OG394_05485 [Kribbella sp. NBC_01245]|uniref:hypothetical protein n=1 Tax=Kribbella sp. NBC_01245 TaxID=2903578 RepID=UPI002E2E0B34|nr:hypothetical protein [Kribbella sp. NBC_01245]